MPLPSDTDAEGKDPAGHQQPALDNAATDRGWSARATGLEAAAMSRVKVLIESRANASELYVVNRAYALVAKGVGTLEVMLEPGQYKVRQRIGYAEQVQDLSVPPGPSLFNAKLPPLDFPSPIPLAGTSLTSMKAGHRPFSMGTGNFRFILRAPVESGSTLSASRFEHMRAELARLRLEHFDGRAVPMPFGEAAAVEADEDALVVSGNLEPGMYVIVQGVSDQRQVCMPVVVQSDRTTAVFCLALSDEGQPVPVHLGHSAVAMLRSQDLGFDYEQSLLCLEAARKAISAGRHVYGWSRPFRHGLGPEVENALLLLMDAQLGWRCLNPRITDQGEPLPEGERPTLEVDAAEVARIVQCAQSILGPACADVFALSASLTPEREEREVLSLMGPPLLKRSWEQLLATAEGNALASDLMAFAFQVEASPTWFLWSEAPGARAAAATEPAVPGITLGAGIEGGVPTLPTSSEGLGGLTRGTKMAAIELGLNALGQFIRRVPILKRTPAPVALDRLTMEGVEAILAALLNSKSFKEWLSKAEQAYEASGKAIKDEATGRLIAGLRAFSDPTLVSALGPEAVARQVLAALRLPRSRVVQLVKDLIEGVTTRLAGPEQAAILAVLHDATEAAERLPSSPAPDKEQER
jgi:hypothetical protein